jgi:hypothetical protein
MHFASWPVCAQPAPPIQRILSSFTYVREASDHDWNLQIAGNIPSYSQLYFLVYNVKGRIIFRGAVYGKYTKEKPLLIPIKADGVTGDYKIIILGKSLLDLNRPITDLPLEVYGGRDFSLAQDKILAYFRPPTGVSKMAMAAYSGDLEVFNIDGSVLADTKATGKVVTDLADPNSKFFGKSDKMVEFPVQAGQTYKLNAAETMYFKTRELTCFAFDPARLFEPDSELDKLRWWELIP